MRRGINGRRLASVAPRLGGRVVAAGRVTAWCTVCGKSWLAGGRAVGVRSWVSWRELRRLP